MTPNQLKNSILQLAIQGKLTESWRLSVKRKEIRDERLEEFFSNRESVLIPSLRAIFRWRGNPENAPLIKGRCREVTERFLNNNELIKNPPVRHSLTSPFKKEGILKSTKELIKQSKVFYNEQLI